MPNRIGSIINFSGLRFFFFKATNVFPCTFSSIFQRLFYLDLFYPGGTLHASGSSHAARETCMQTDVGITGRRTQPTLVVRQKHSFINRSKAVPLASEADVDIWWFQNTLFPHLVVDKELLVSPNKVCTEDLPRINCNYTKYIYWKLNFIKLHFRRTNGVVSREVSTFFK